MIVFPHSSSPWLLLFVAGDSNATSDDKPTSLKLNLRPKRLEDDDDMERPDVTRERVTLSEDRLPIRSKGRGKGKYKVTVSGRYFMLFSELLLLYFLFWVLLLIHF